MFTTAARTVTAAAHTGYLAVRKAGKEYPTGNPNFSVKQAFPSAFSAEEADPFLMCDEIGPKEGYLASSPDDFPVSWHPHRGMDIVTYIRQGTGRHADSLGNRCTFEGPGMQWISVGSGIEHAEGGGTPAGQKMHGFQIWINVPSDKKMDDPRYGTESPDDIPRLELPNAAGTVRVLAGGFEGKATGPFRTVQDVQMLDLELHPSASVEHTVPASHDNTMLYVCKGEAIIEGAAVAAGEIIRLDASNPQARLATIEAGPAGAVCMVFSGVRLNQPIAWHGPFVMTTQAEIADTLNEYRCGTLLRKRVSWNYKVAAEAPDYDIPDPADDTKAEIRGKQPMFV